MSSTYCLVTAYNHPLYVAVNRQRPSVSDCCILHLEWFNTVHYVCPIYFCLLQLSQDVSLQMLLSLTSFLVYCTCKVILSLLLLPTYLHHQTLFSDVLRRKQERSALPYQSRKTLPIFVLLHQHGLSTDVMPLG